MIKPAFLALTACAVLCFTGCSAGLSDTLAPAATPAASEAQQGQQGGSGPAVPRAASAEGIRSLITVTQAKADAASDEALQGLVESILDLLGGSEALERNLDMHETAVIGQMPYTIWKVVECSTGAALAQLPPAPGQPNALTLVLESLPERTAYATYGIKEMPSAWRIFNLHIEGRGERFYVAVTDRNRQAWGWAGPFELGSGEGTELSMASLNIQLPAVQNSGADGFAYFTLVPASGTELYVKGLSAGVGDTSLVIDPGFDDDDVLADF
ncbi:hypothetical protein IT575_02715 [bacterium]|nr:hypothetical protein [bacterium]